MGEEIKIMLRPRGWIEVDQEMRRGRLKHNVCKPKGKEIMMCLGPKNDFQYF